MILKNLGRFSSMLCAWLVTFGFLISDSLGDNVIAAAQYRLRYAITENQPDDLRIGKLDDDLIHTPEVRSTELFNLLHSSNYGALRYRLRDPSSLFVLDDQTSILSTKQSIDLEGLCPRYCRNGATRAQLVQVVSVLYEQRVVALVHVEVTVIDVDDNPPRFPKTIPRPYVLQLKEVIYRVGQQVELPRALDQDVQPDHAEIAYRLESVPDDQTNALEVFHLIARNDSRLMLLLQRDLDYEDVKSYRFYLIAWSPRQGDRTRKPFQSGSAADFHDKLEIQVDVMNINDISPVFGKSLYTVELPEDTQVGSTIYKLEATDGDENSTIRYTVEDASDPDIERLFQVQPSGEVKLKDRLNYEKRTKYAFSVRASDGEFFALTRLEFNVLDVNDELPEFVSNPAQLTVQENEPPETYVGQLFITDRDSPEVNGHVFCQEPEHLVNKQPLLFHPQNNPTTEQVLPGVGQIALGAPVSGPEHRVYQRFDLYSRYSFDRETDPHVQLSLLVCTDGQQQKDSISVDQNAVSELPRLTGTLTISLAVADQNDNAPVFERQYYEAELKENSPRGTRVVQVHATDADSEPYAKPRYSLLQNELFTSNFEVEPQTGWIVTYADIDREAQSVYQLLVLAIDGWQSDTHENRNPMVRFSPSKTSSQHTATTRVQIRVLDENDNAPEFRGPRQFAVEENQPANTWIADLQVMDRDEGLNKEVEFVLTSQSLLDGKSENTAKHVESNNSILSHGVLPLRLSSNGSLYTKTKLDRENQSHYCFEVTVRDRAPNNPLSSTDTICVRVLDMNDNAPRFKRIKGSLSDSGLKDNGTAIDPLEQDINTDVSDVVVPVSVHEGPGYCALIAEAEDADEGRNALLRYDIKSFGKESEISHTVTAFMMDPQSGRMMLARHLSTEEIGTHSITLTVDDSGSPSKQAELVVQLQIEDSPMRGNWLLPENELARTASSNSKGDYMEGHTILIVIVLSGISAFLASVLISAILCMIKPCRGSTRTRDSVRFTKGTGAAQSGKYGPGGTAQNKCPGNYADYNLSLLDMNGYAGGVDPAMESRVSQMTAAQIPGLEQLYLPSDKLIGVDSSFQTCSSIMEDASWPGCSNVSTLLGSQPLDRISPPVPMCEYTITQPLNNSWNNTTQARTNIWTTATIGSGNTPAGYSAHCTNCHDTVTQPNSPLRLGFTTDNNSTVAHPIASMVAPFQMTQFLPPLLSERGERDCAEYDGSDLGKVHPRTCKPNRIVTLGIGASCQEPTPDLAGAPVGEEQRSDSGRGASDEEIGSQTVPNTSYNGNAIKVRSATLRSTQENASHMMSGLVFPSLPRISSASGVGTGPSNTLTTFESPRTTRNSISCDTADTTGSSGGKVAMIRFPKSHVV